MLPLGGSIDEMADSVVPSHLQNRTKSFPGT